MKTYDLMIVGPATRDVNIDYTGIEDRSAGGAVTFCTPAALAAGAKVFAAVKRTSSTVSVWLRRISPSCPRRRPPS